MKNAVKQVVKSLDRTPVLKGALRTMMAALPGARLRYQVRAAVEKQWATELRSSRRGFIYPSNQEIGIFADEFGFHGSEIVETLRAYHSPGVILEVGANIGSDTLLMADAFPDAAIYAFEPVRAFHACLLWNAPASVCVERCAVSSTAGEKLTLNINMNSASLVNNMSRSFPTVRQETIETTTIDAYVAARGLTQVDFIKTDTDGNDFAVICGARETIARHAPYLFVEFSDGLLRRVGSSNTELAALLISSGYSDFIVFHGHNAKGIAVSRGGLASALPQGDTTANVFAVPHTREKSAAGR